MPLLAFVFVSTITPGPNNLLLAASGIRFGVRRTLPHVLGIHIGVYGLVVLCGMGLGQMLLALPGAAFGLKIFATVYLVYLAWKIMGMQITGEMQTERPMKVWEAALFQLSNPKAWMMAVSGLNIALAIDNSMILAGIALCVGFATLGAVCNLTWVYLGASLQSALAKPGMARWINISLATLTALTVLMFWLA